MPTYSFLDTQATIAGPGGTISLGSGAAVADEGITFEKVEADNTMTTGADGAGMHSLNPTKSYKISVRLLKTSPVNQQLSQMYAIQKASSGAWGNNVISLKNTISGDSAVAALTAFAKFPSITWAKNPSMNEWTFESIDCDVSLGGGIIANLTSFGVGTV
jgi:hypothetical protein